MQSFTLACLLASALIIFVHTDARRDHSGGRPPAPNGTYVGNHTIPPRANFTGPRPTRIPRFHGNHSEEHSPFPLNNSTRRPDNSEGDSSHERPRPPNRRQ